MPGQTASPIPRRAHLTLFPARPAVTAACLTLTNLAGVQGPWPTWPHFPKGRGHLRKLQPSGPGWDELTRREVEGKRKRQSVTSQTPTMTSRGKGYSQIIRGGIGRAKSSCRFAVWCYKKSEWPLWPTHYNVQIISMGTCESQNHVNGIQLETAFVALVLCIRPRNA